MHRRAVELRDVEHVHHRVHVERAVQVREQLRGIGQHGALGMWQRRWCLEAQRRAQQLRHDQQQHQIGLAGIERIEHGAYLVRL